MHFHGLLLCAIVTGAFTSRLDDYCKINYDNTPCATRCIRHKRCGDTGTAYRTLTRAERKLVLSKHNEIRNAAAKGEYVSKYIPACAGGINVLSYDKEVEFLAGCHIKGCKFEHDYVRYTLSRGATGQNLYEIAFASDIGYTQDFFENAVHTWFNEHKQLTANDSIGFDKFPTPVSTWHLTALLWGKTQYLGCAKMHYTKKKLHHYALFCNYLPAGNHIGMPIYANSACQEMSSKYKNLCGVIRPIADDTYIAPIVLDSGHNLRCPLYLIIINLAVYSALTALH